MSLFAVSLTGLISSGGLRALVACSVPFRWAEAVSLANQRVCLRTGPSWRVRVKDLGLFAVPCHSNRSSYLLLDYTSYRDFGKRPVPQSMCGLPSHTCEGRQDTAKLRKHI